MLKTSTPLGVNTGYFAQIQMIWKRQVFNPDAKPTGGTSRHNNNLESLEFLYLAKSIKYSESFMSSDAKYDMSLAISDASKEQKRFLRARFLSQELASFLGLVSNSSLASNKDVQYSPREVFG